MELDDGTVRKLRKTSDITHHSHELTFTCYHRLPLLSRDRTRHWFVDALNRTCKDQNVAPWAWVIMPEHAHVLIFPRNPESAGRQTPVADFLKSVKQSVARRATDFLRQHNPDWLANLRVVWPNGRVEHRFWQQGGGYDREMFKCKAIWSAIEYLHNNPVRRKLAARAGDWEWSSARVYAGDGPSKATIDWKDLPRNG